MAQKKRCNCDDRRKVNAHRSDGRPVALWTCPIHGNVFEDRNSEILLTELQEGVLKMLSDGYKSGNPPTVDEMSKALNRPINSVEMAISVLQTLNFIEPIHDNG